MQLNGLRCGEQGIPGGLCRIVADMDDYPAILMQWDTGRMLILMPFEDSFTVVQQDHARTLNEQLCDKLCQVQRIYARELLILPPADIFEKVWENLVREDILVTLE